MLQILTISRRDKFIRDIRINRVSETLHFPIFGNTAPHGHFVCRTCGAVIDLPPIPVELPDMTAVGEADSCGVVFYGRCNGCLAEKKTS